MSRRDKRFNSNHKIKKLEAQNRILKRQLKQAHNERQYYMKMGYEQCRQQMLSSLDMYKQDNSI